MPEEDQVLEEETESLEEDQTEETSGEEESEEDTQDTTEESESNSQAEDDEPYEEEQEETVNYERLQKKSQTLEQQNAAYQKQLDVYGQWLLEDQKRTTEYLRSQGLDEIQVAESINRIKQNKPGIWEPKVEPKPGEAPVQPPIDVQRIKTEVRTEMALDNYVQTSQKQFFAEVPEMDPSQYVNATPEERQLVQEFATKVDYLAKSLMRIQDLSYKDALKSSYNTLIQQLGGFEKEEEEERPGYYEGLAEANADDATSFGEMGGDSDADGSSLSAQERVWAEKLGMNENEYAKYKRNK